MARAIIQVPLVVASLAAACGGSTIEPGTTGDHDAGSGGDAAADRTSDGPMVCVPGTTEPCYTGPAGSDGIGPCHGGTRTCSDGSVFGQCTGEVTPNTENCDTPEDEDCDGHTECGKLLWAKSFGDGTSPSGAGAADVAVDAAGNIIVVGWFDGTIDFGNGPLDAGGSDAVFVVKLDPSGAALWSRAFPLSGGIGVGVDSQGNIIVGGTFSGSVDFGLGPLESTASLHNIYVAAFGANGQTVWSRRFGPGEAFADLAVGPDGRIVLGGDFSGTLDLGGSPMSTPDPSASDMFLAMLAPDGSRLWSRDLGSGACEGVAVAPGDRVVFAQSAESAESGFVLETDSVGKTLWSTEVATDYQVHGPVACADANGNVLGAWIGHLDYHAYAFALDANGKSLWTRGPDDTAKAEIYDTAADTRGNLVIAGRAEGIDLGSVHCSGAAFVMKFSALGDRGVWCHGAGAGDYDSANGVAITPDNDVVVAGSFNTKYSDFDLGNGPLPHLGNANNVFIAKFSP